MQPDIIAGRYRVVRPVGRGGMGTVWLCTDETLHRQVAVKQIGSLPGESPDDTARAMREARLAAALNHKNAVSIYDVVEQGGTTWLVMEYVPSQTLSQLIASEGRMPPARVAHIGVQVAAALTSAHSLGIVHRDIKPGNVLVGDEDVAMISDFGIARGHQDTHLTQTGMVTGTPAFFSPELARGEDPSFASDVWALGITLYTATEGTPPYEPHSNPLAMLSTIAREPPPPPAHAGPLTGALAEMLHPDASRRSTMAGALAALQAVDQPSNATAGDQAAEKTSALPEHVRSNRTAIIEDSVEPVYERPVTVPAVTSSWSDGRTHHEPPPPRERPGAGRLALALLGLLVLVGAGTLLWNVLDLGAGNTPDPTSSNSSNAADGRTRQPPTKDPGTSISTNTPTSQSGSTSAEPSPTPSTSEATTPPTTDQTTPAPPASAGRVGFTRSYYATVLDDLDAGWSMIAPSMQEGLGRQSYDDFWGSIDSVDVSSVVAVDSETVRYQITYTFDNGTTSVENKQLTLQPNNGSYLITSDTTVG